MRTIITITPTEDLKSKYKPGSDYYLGQTLSQLEAKKRNLCHEEPFALYARFRFLIAKISLLSIYCNVLSIGTPKNKLSIVPNGILVILGVPKFGQITAA